MQKAMSVVLFLGHIFAPGYPNQSSEQTIPSRGTSNRPIQYHVPLNLFSMPIRPPIHPPCMNV